jgi:hypothetical protein
MGDKVAASTRLSKLIGRSFPDFLKEFAACRKRCSHVGNSPTYRQAQGLIGMVSEVQLVLVDLVIDAAWRDSEETSRLRSIAARFMQGGFYQQSLAVLYRSCEVPAAHLQQALDAGGKCFWQGLRNL